MVLSIGASLGQKKIKNGGSSLEEAYQNRKAGMERADERLSCVCFTQLWYGWVPSNSREDKIKARWVSPGKGMATKIDIPLLCFMLHHWPLSFPVCKAPCPIASEVDIKRHCIWRTAKAFENSSAVANLSGSLRRKLLWLPHCSCRVKCWC